MKFRDLDIDDVFRFSRDAELDIGKAVFQKSTTNAAFLRDDITIDPDTEVELAEIDDNDY
jgi:hypothetical protein